MEFGTSLHSNNEITSDLKSNRIELIILIFTISLFKIYKILKSCT